MKDLLRIALPFTVWMISFGTVYALHGIVCQPDWQEADIPTVSRNILITAAGLGVAAHGAVVLLLRRADPVGGSHFVKRIAMGLSVSALFSSVWSALPILMLPMCR